MAELVVDVTLLKKLGRVHTATVSDILDSMGMRGFMAGHIKPLVELRKPMVGVATTVLWKTTRKPSDSNINTISESLLAIDRANRGEVYVTAGLGGPEGEFKDISLIGGLMTESMVARGLAGAISDTGVRDIDHMKSLGFPMFGRYPIPTGTIGRCVIASTGTPITCGGITVHQGDVVMGDNDGVVVLSPRLLKAIVEKALRFEETERKEIKEIRAGKRWSDFLKGDLRI